MFFCSLKDSLKKWLAANVVFPPHKNCRAVNHRPEAPPTTTVYNRLTSEQSANVGLAGEGINIGEIQLLRNMLKPQAGPKLPLKT